MINFNNVKDEDYLICIKYLNNKFATFIKNKEYKLCYTSIQIIKNRPFKIYIDIEDIEDSFKFEFYNSETNFKSTFYYDDYFIDKNSYRKDKLKKLL